jgi:hypothetical protein
VISNVNVNVNVNVNAVDLLEAVDVHVHVEHRQSNVSDRSRVRGGYLLPWAAGWHTLVTPVLPPGNGA